MIVFEFFSGIGGMHQALSEINNLKIKSIYPFDINTNANLVYYHNFGNKSIEMSIENFSIEDYENICTKEEC